jgi:hypothetical protein
LREKPAQGTKKEVRKQREKRNDNSGKHVMKLVDSTAYVLASVGVKAMGDL